jgi:Zn-dependent protease with chaperone function
MREFVIKSLDILIWVVAGIIAVGGVIVGLLALVQGEVGGLAIIIIAPLYAILFCGMFLLAVGVYNHTKRTAEALEKLAAR